MSHSRHAIQRSQQRGIPPLIDQLLDLYGHEQHDGRGAVILYLTKDSVRRMERDMGREPVRQLARWRHAYKVKSIADGGTITVGHRTKRIRRA